MRWKHPVRKKRIVSALLVLVGLLALGTLLFTGIIWPNYLFVSDYSVRGLDVSNHQKHIDWKSVARTGEYSFVFIKATEGKTYQDAYFQANWRGSQEQGLLRSAYHFFSEDVPGSEQADNFISMVPKEAGMLPPVLDLEVTGKDRKVMLREVNVFLTRLEQHYGMKPIIYTDHERYAEYIQGNFENYAIWIRDVFTPVQWSNVKNWTFWQYCHRKLVPGIPTFVDLNVFYGKKEQLYQLTMKRTHP